MLMIDNPHLETRREIFGGEPVIKGTRLTCKAVLGRVAGGETIDDLCADYHPLPREAIEAAISYARNHPTADEDAEGKPWRPRPNDPVREHSPGPTT
jgi:uncharacterized protein (DUF433 family)